MSMKGTSKTVMAIIVQNMMFKPTMVPRHGPARSRISGVPNSSRRSKRGRDSISSVGSSPL
jgi:hypothetical protein